MAMKAKTGPRRASSMVGLRQGSPRRSGRQMSPEFQRRADKVIRSIALAMIVLSAIGGFVLVNPAVGAGLTVLALIRLAIWWREEKRAGTPS